jgi:hypothetical protein
MRRKLPEDSSIEEDTKSKGMISNMDIGRQFI